MQEEKRSLEKQEGQEDATLGVCNAFLAPASFPILSLLCQWLPGMIHHPPNTPQLCLQVPLGTAPLPSPVPQALSLALQIKASDGLRRAAAPFSVPVQKSHYTLPGKNCSP